MTRSPLVVVAGPTASGKSGLALRLAQALNPRGEILSADSQQVYRGLDIGTAKPSLDAREGIEHHLIDFSPLSEQVTAAEFAHRAEGCIAACRERGHRALIVGGTGLWIKSLLYGLAPAPPRDEGLRRRLEAVVASKGALALHAQLQREDPASAQVLHPNDTLRVIRAIEVARTGGQPRSRLHDAHGFSDPRYPHLHLALSLPRTQLRERIRSRSEAMMQAGWVDETRRLYEAGHRDRLLKVLGYAQIVQWFEGDLAESELRSRIVSRTWAYAKRQLNWLRSCPGVVWLPAENTEAAFDRALNVSEAFLASQGG